MAHAIEYLLATPTISPHLPAKSFMVESKKEEGNEAASASAAAPAGAGSLPLAARVAAHAVGRAAATLVVVRTAPAAVPLLARPVPLTAEPRLPATTALTKPAATALPMSLPLRPVTDGIAVHFPAATAASALLPDRELRLFALGHVSFRARKRGAYQRPVNGALVFRRSGPVARVVRRDGVGARGHRRRRGLRHGDRRFGLWRRWSDGFDCGFGFGFGFDFGGGAGRRRQYRLALERLRTVVQRSHGFRLARARHA